MPIDVESNVKLLELAAPAAVTATGNGTGVDRTGLEGRGVALLASAAGTGTTPTLDVKLQDSADDVTYADIVGATFTQVTGAAAAFEKIAVELDLSGIKKFIRAVDTVGGSTPSFTRSIMLAAAAKVVAVA